MKWCVRIILLLVSWTITRGISSNGEEDVDGEEPPFMMRSSYFLDGNTDKEFVSYFANREELQEDTVMVNLNNAERVAEYIMNNTKPRFMAMIDPIWENESLQSMARNEEVNTFKTLSFGEGSNHNTRRMSEKYVFSPWRLYDTSEGLKLQRSDQEIISSKPSRNTGERSSMSCSYASPDTLSANFTLNKEQVVMSINHMETLINALNGIYPLPIVTQCRYLWVSNIFIMDVDERHDNITHLQEYIFNIWDHNQQIWLLEADSKLSFRVDDERNNIYEADEKYSVFSSASWPMSPCICQSQCEFVIPTIQDCEHFLDENEVFSSYGSFFKSNCYLPKSLNGAHCSPTCSMQNEFNYHDIDLCIHTEGVCDVSEAVDFECKVIGSELDHITNFKKNDNLDFHKIKEISFLYDEELTQNFDDVCSSITLSPNICTKCYNTMANLENLKSKSHNSKLDENICLIKYENGERNCETSSAKDKFSIFGQCHIEEEEINSNEDMIGLMEPLTPEWHSNGDDICSPYCVNELRDEGIRREVNNEGFENVTQDTLYNSFFNVSYWESSPYKAPSAMPEDECEGWGCNLPTSLKWVITFLPLLDRYAFPIIDNLVSRSTQLLAPLNDDLAELRESTATSFPVPNFNSFLDNLFGNSQVGNKNKGKKAYKNLIPDDTYFDKQWGLYNTAYSNIDVNALPAWNTYYNEPNKHHTVVAHIDTGVEINHPDLIGKIWVNRDEIPNDNIDNDGNGYIDDVNGWNFVDNNNDLTDLSGHGTHTAGILGATINNMKGIAGLGVDIEIMPLKIHNKASEAVEAIEYSLNKGAPISTNSWGFVLPIKVLKVALDKAEKQNQLFVCAVDNKSKDNTYMSDFPANWGQNTLIPYQSEANDCILRVASIDIDGYLSASSNYGPYNVDIAAPGRQILSTVPKRLYGGNYAFKSGTSMATPFVAAAAALMHNIYPLTAVEMRHIIIEKARKLRTLENSLVSGGILDTASVLEETRRIKNHRYYHTELE